MRKNLKKISALAIVSAMVMGSLAGCGGNNDPTTTAETTTANEPTTTANSSSQTEPTTSATSNATGMDAWEPFAERVQITVPVYDRSKEGYQIGRASCRERV